MLMGSSGRSSSPSSASPGILGWATERLDGGEAIEPRLLEIGEVNCRSQAGQPRSVQLHRGRQLSSSGASFSRKIFM